MHLNYVKHLKWQPKVFNIDCICALIAMTNSSVLFAKSLLTLVFRKQMSRRKQKGKIYHCFLSMSSSLKRPNLTNQVSRITNPDIYEDMLDIDSNFKLSLLFIFARCESLYIRYTIYDELSFHWPLVDCDSETHITHIS